jgi:hypothetical protein
LAALLISPVNPEKYKDNVQSIIKGNYHIGWLMEFKDGAAYVTWGMSNNLDNAIMAAKDNFRQNGKKELLIYDKPLKNKLSLDEVKSIRQFTLEKGKEYE